jgi:hypothetical protein
MYSPAALTKYTRLLTAVPSLPVDESVSMISEGEPTLCDVLKDAVIGISYFFICI